MTEEEVQFLQFRLEAWRTVAFLNPKAINLYTEAFKEILEADRERKEYELQMDS